MHNFKARSRVHLAGSSAFFFEDRSSLVIVKLKASTVPWSLGFRLRPYIFYKFYLGFAQSCLVISAINSGPLSVLNETGISLGFSNISSRHKAIDFAFLSLSRKLNAYFES